MSDRLPSDHPTVETHRVTVSRHGGGRRIDVSEEVLPIDPPVRLILEENTRYARVAHPPDGSGSWITGAFASPHLARTGSGDADELAQWLDDRSIRTGSSLHLDVLEAGFSYGLREAGERVIYRDVSPPARSLADIARSLRDHDQAE